MNIHFFLAAIVLAPTAFAADYLMYIGTYTKKAGGSKGIYAFRFDPATGKAQPLGLMAETPSPSWVTFSPDKRFLYAANEQGPGSVSSFGMDSKSGKLTALNVVASHGSSPCHLVVDKSGKLLYDANYGGGTVAAFSIQPDGSLSDSPAVVHHEGSSVDAARQEGPHPHSVNLSPDQRFLLVPDLGLDKIFVYKPELKPNDPPFAAIKPGSGPRHLAFHPKGKFVYVVSEMGSTVTAFSYDAKQGSLSQLQSISTLPADFKGENNDAEIAVHPDGKFLYASNRGHDSIAVFSIDGKGMLTSIQDVPTEGHTPRNFAIDPTGKWLLAANQDSDNIVFFKLDKKTGKLTPSGESVKLGAPVCIQFVK